ncbi:MAG: hypothetical protein MUF54_10390 [Polyangiaceae bacterium]|jgi:hypothetical protein|nr:hypothetical protein [Polyangiaceae bacterium]
MDLPPKFVSASNNTGQPQLAGASDSAHAIFDADDRAKANPGRAQQAEATR